VAQWAHTRRRKSLDLKEESAVSEEKRPRGRPPKYPPAEVRQRLIDAAIERLRVSGVESGLDAVTLDGAIIDASVPRGMSYKIWREGGDASPQDAFRHATVLALLSIPAVAGLPKTKEFAATQIDAASAELASADIDTRRAAVREIIRVVAAFNHDALKDSIDWRLYMALRTAAITRPGADDAVMDALRTGEDFLIRSYSDFYTEVAAQAGLRLRAEFDMLQFSTVAYSLNEGLATRLTTSVSQSSITTPDSDSHWSLFAVALEGLIYRFFEWEARD